MSTMIRQFINAISDKRVAKQLHGMLDSMLPTDLDTGIVAQADGTKANATVIREKAKYHVIATSAGAADSILLPYPHVGNIHLVKNNGANTVQVFADGTGTVNSQATATGITQQAGDAILYFCSAEGNYEIFGGATASTTLSGTVTVDALVGGDSSLGITGQATAQGGDVVVTGGASSTGANAGGAASLIGGAGGATGVGGAAIVTGAAGQGDAAGGAATVTAGGGQGTGAGAIASLIGGASGAGATGNGGIAKVVAGAATSTNGNGGAAQLTGGLGTGTGAGGAITITSGAAGATGVAGVVSITVGAATAGNGSAMTLTGGNGAGGTASGGNINLVPGTAVSTGVPGEVTVNSVAGTFEVSYTSPLMTTAVPATGTAQPIYVATRAMRLKKAYCSVVTHGTSETISLTKDASGAAPGAGTAMLAAVMTPAVSNTPVTQAASSTIAIATLAAGDRISFLTGGTIGTAAGLTITLLLVPV